MIGDPERAQTPAAIKVGTVGWGIPKQYAADFADRGSHLERYAQRFSAVEINSCFYRPHQPRTYARWAASVPPGFRFAVKMPREITHVRRLVDSVEPLERFLSQTAALADRHGPLLVQLPPSLDFDEAIACRFFDQLRVRFDGAVACEPRHGSWFTTRADALLSQVRVGRVAADPPPVPQAVAPGGYPGIAYRRLHGSPRIYYSGYTADDLEQTAGALCRSAAQGQEQWCFFDNTALGEATGDAMTVLQRLGSTHSW